MRDLALMILALISTPALAVMAHGGNGPGGSSTTNRAVGDGSGGLLGHASAIVEASPLRGAAGEPSARGELFYTPQLAFGLGYDASTAASERADFTDRYQALSAEAVYYPLTVRRYPVFAATGIRVEQAELGRQRLRDTTTWSRTNADEVNDTWVNDDTYYSWTQSVGYRLFAERWLTASLRATRDQLLTTSSTAVDQNVVTPSADLSTHGRDPVMYRLSLDVGIWLP